MADRWTEVDRELVASALLTAARSPRYRPVLADLSPNERAHFNHYAGRVLDALTAAGWRREDSIAAALALADTAIAAYPDDQDTHYRQCHLDHASCLAHRIRRTLTQEAADGDR